MADIVRTPGNEYAARLADQKLRMKAEKALYERSGADLSKLSKDEYEQVVSVEIEKHPKHDFGGENPYVQPVTNESLSRLGQQ